MTESNLLEMPRWKCHKVVRALKIKALESGPNNDKPSVFITPEDEGYSRFLVSGDYLERHKPEPGGYYVLYEDGYASFSPAEAFEAGYTRVDESVGVMQELLKHVEAGQYGVITCCKCGEIMERCGSEREMGRVCAGSAFRDGWRLGLSGAECGECHREAAKQG